MVERFLAKEEVASSSLVIRFSYNFGVKNNVDKIFNNLKNNKRLIILLFVAFVSLIVFIKLLDNVVEKEAITILDSQILNFIYTNRNEKLNTFFLLITSLGNPLELTIVVIFVTTILIIKRHKYYALVLLISLVFNIIFVTIIKFIIERPRPPINYALVIENNFSFPSAHTIIAVTFYGVIFYFLARAIKNKYFEYFVIFLGIVLTLLIGISRIYLGVHWTSDVLASYCLGIVWFCILVILLDHTSYVKKLVKKLYRLIFNIK